jgi:hypothetical protein
MAFYDSGDALYGTGAYGSASYGIVTPTVALTGVSGTALTRTIHINAFEIDITEPLYGPNALVGSIGTLEFANTVTLAGVAGTGQIGTVSPNIAFGITGVIGTTGTGLTQPQYRLSEKVDSVSATFTIGTLNIRSVNRVPVTMPAMTGFVTAPEPRVDETITIGVQGTTALGSIQVNIAEKVDSVSATGSIGALEHSNTVTLTGVEGVAQVGEVEDQPTERIVSGVQGTGAIGTVALSNAFTVTGVQGTFGIGSVTATGVTFTFVAADYDRRRVAYVPRNDTAAERRMAA